MGKAAFTVKIVLMVAFLSGCTPSRQVSVETDGKGEDKANTTAGKILEDFNPQSLRDEEINIKELELKAKRKADETSHQTTSTKPQIQDSKNSELPTNELFGDEKNDSLSTLPQKREMVWGWRVQICAFRNELDARSVQREALLKFEDQVYLTYDSPYYKVRIGDCLSRYEADDLQQIAIEKGFDDAWVVKTKVNKFAKSWDNDTGTRQ
ncbi:SPOR domain-containing protein [candidate division KSB1 bacterium]|nr:SPOR domain-containing protein [candidate division KSB1 bacterium]